MLVLWLMMFIMKNSVVLNVVWLSRCVVVVKCLFVLVSL